MRKEFEVCKVKAIRAIVPAAGKGKRLQKISGELPKAMFPACGRPMLETVLENLRAIESVPMIVRTTLIPGVTDTRENLRAIAEFLAGKENLKYYELLNFNPLGSAKYAGLGADNAFASARPYTHEQLEAFRSMVADIVSVKVGG